MDLAFIEIFVTFSIIPYACLNASMSLGKQPLWFIYILIYILAPSRPKDTTATIIIKGFRALATHQGCMRINSPIGQAIHVDRYMTWGDQLMLNNPIGQTIHVDRYMTWGDELVFDGTGYTDYLTVPIGPFGKKNRSVEIHEALCNPPLRKRILKCKNKLRSAPETIAWALMQPWPLPRPSSF